MAGLMLKHANTTRLALIPKKDVVNSVQDFRPISCCTGFYKIVSKVISNRMKRDMPILVGYEQGPFVANRSTSENILLSQSLVKGYDRKNISLRSLLKVDIRKAFDSLQWEFILDMLKAFHFPPLFIK